ncbi:hypothetical protein JJB07_16545 [Tumebacillus sp. ITR2]|uniref:WXG100 family type VII secretion target n=1 Tax=Tumebacillus amylolyticus TaxID=2801339 RepID=A0ABS1JD63_9BACL|nr:hypothetical protein [Tumebacillus amylolyticus]MBL0388224.1 hypothetical protein [Tumebacillus amylolyticus]
MKQPANTFLLRNGASRFGSAVHDVQRLSSRVEQAAETDQWKGQAATDFRSLAGKVREDLRTAGLAFDHISQSLNQLAGHLDNVNHLRQQAQGMEGQIHALQSQLHNGEPEERYSLQMELNYLQGRYHSLQQEADSLEAQANQTASAQFYDIEGLVGRMNAVRGGLQIKAGTQQKSEDEDITSASDFLAPGAVTALILSGSIRFEQDPQDPRSYFIKTAGWVKGESRFSKWNSIVSWSNQNVFEKFSQPNITEKSLGNQLKDFAGMEGSAAKIGFKTMPLHLAKRAVGPLGIAMTVWDEKDKLTESWDKNTQPGVTQQEFYHNFSGDVASSLNTVVFKSVGTIVGTAIGGAIGGAFIGPAGAVIGGAFGGMAGEWLGAWVAEKTDGVARDLGQKIGDGIANQLDKANTTSKTSVAKYDNTLKAGIPGVFMKPIM